MSDGINEDAFNQSIRKFLKHFGVTAQREIERAVRDGVARGALRTTDPVPVRATLTIGGVAVDFHVDGELTLS